LARLRAILALLGLTVVLSTPGTAQNAPGFRVIVNARNPDGSLERRFVADAFLKKTSRWPNGQAILPVDQGAEVTPRRKFSEDVLQRSVAAVRSYWQQQIFSGRDVPPPELDSDAAVVAYVNKNAGAIGYVGPSVELGAARAVALK
jgi:ABC-type phosphate transport system substrate-binding protein